MTRIRSVVLSAAAIVTVVPWAQCWRRVVGISLIGTLIAILIVPAPALGQLLGGIDEILAIINGEISGALDLMEAVSRSLESLYEQVVWPIRLIDQARSTVASLIAQFRNAMQALYAVGVSSATLQDPISLESIIRNRQTSDFAALTQSYYRTFGALPTADQADSLARNLIDIDDGLALDTLKTLKATDQAGDLIVNSGNRIEDEAQYAAPGSAPFLTAASMAANIQSQAMMQKMLAAMLRQEAARIAHENTLRKRNAILGAKVRQNLSDILRRP